MSSLQPGVPLQNLFTPGTWKNGGLVYHTDPLQAKLSDVLFVLSLVQQGLEAMSCNGHH